MKLLLDTCTFLWLAVDAPELSAKAREDFQSPENDVYLSSVSAWEIAVKYSIGRLPLPRAPESLVPDLRKRLAVEPLSLDEAAALHLARLPELHKDLFDRMLICQALVHGLAIVTPDEDIRRYPVQICW